MSVTWSWRRRRSGNPPELLAVPPGVSVSAQPVLTKSEAEFYNVLKFTVQDRYLVLSQVPVWCLVEISSADETLRRAVLGKLALKRVDFVLVHPGTLAVAKVVELNPPAETPNQQTRDRFLDAVFKQAGIERVRIPPKSEYTMPVVASLLGLDLPD